MDEVTQTYCLNDRNQMNIENMYETQICMLVYFTVIAIEAHIVEMPFLSVILIRGSTVTSAD